jgi:2-amino-4-hydroxy-6-hydroxymethyldihydropteridine diphosphokinase
MMEQVFIGFGSNQGDSESICRQALEMLGRRPDITIRRVSSLYRTEPVGMTEQGWFLNGAALCETELDPERVLDVTQSIENRLGRVRLERWGPRTLDLDILFFGDLQIDLPELTVPHPRLHERRFVLIPLVEIAPSWIHPAMGLTMLDLLERLDASGQEVTRYKTLWFDC